MKPDRDWTWSELETRGRRLFEEALAGEGLDRRIEDAAEVDRMALQRAAGGVRALYLQALLGAAVRMPARLVRALTPRAWRAAAPRNARGSR
ncbi:hypothetical protein [Salinarimonas sp.]|uniref:hypothetical protein n=1 Tax=Salinarimonas sp. TaxID=2766526 RepID=UPI0032D92F7B